MAKAPIDPVGSIVKTKFGNTVVISSRMLSGRASGMKEYYGFIPGSEDVVKFRTNHALNGERFYQEYPYLGPAKPEDVKKGKLLLQLKMNGASVTADIKGQELKVELKKYDPAKINVSMLKKLIVRFKQYRDEGKLGLAIQTKKLIDLMAIHLKVNLNKVYEEDKLKKQPAKVRQETEKLEGVLIKRGYKKDKKPNWHNPYLMTFTNKTGETISYDLRTTWWMRFQGTTVVKAGKGSKDLYKELMFSDYRQTATTFNVANGVKQVEDKGGFIRYDSYLIDYLNGSDVTAAIKEGKLIGAHWQHSPGNPGIAGYATPKALKAGKAGGGRLLPSKKQSEDHISSTEFDHRWKSRNSENATWNNLPPGRSGIDQSKPIQRTPSKIFGHYTLGLVWDELTPSIMARILRDCVQLSRVCLSNRVHLHVATTHDNLDNYLKYLGIDRTAHLPAATYWRVYVAKEIMEAPEHATQTDIVHVGQKEANLPRLRYDPEFPARIWYPVYPIPETVPLYKNPPNGQPDPMNQVDPF